MNIEIKEYTKNNLKTTIQIWNEVVTDGNAFPQDTEMTANVANLFFQEQNFSGHRHTVRLQRIKKVEKFTRR